VNKTIGYLVIILLSSYAYAAGGTGSIGTVSVRGNVRVDGYTVSSNGTIFDGTIIETSQSTAILRLNNGNEISLARNSQGVVHGDRMELLRGSGQLKTSAAPFQVEAMGLRITSGGIDATGIVSMSSADTIDVASLSGELRVMDENGLSLARISSAAAMSFPVPKAADSKKSAPTGQPKTITIVGLVSSKDGHFYIEVLSDGTIYELMGRIPKEYIGAKVIAEGTVESATSASGVREFEVKSIQINGGNPHKARGAIITGTTVAGSAAAIAFAAFEATKSSASR